jgi:hypothetical protein
LDDKRRMGGGERRDEEEDEEEEADEEISGAGNGGAGGGGGGVDDNDDDCSRNENPAGSFLGLRNPSSSSPPLPSRLTLLDRPLEPAPTNVPAASSFGSAFEEEEGLDEGRAVPFVDWERERDLEDVVRRAREGDALEEVEEEVVRVEGMPMGGRMDWYWEEGSG